MDFTKLVDIFDRNKVTFVSVTQSFNTTSSMGKLTLNILLSFAQFEREVAGERIRDKVAAFQEEWVARLRRNLEAAVAKGELPPDADLVQILYDITSYLVLAHSRLVFDGNDSGLPLAARAVRIRLGRA
jgi:DNA invertase Pin-like site-specific DNA recombinase